MSVSKLSILLALSSVALAQSGTIARHALPSEVAYPEGVAYDQARNVFYTANATNGVVIEVDMATGRSRTIVPAGVLVPSGTTVFPALLGMKLDGDGRLWLCGGRTGRMHVVDARTGKVIKQFTVPGSGSLINDVVLADGGAYFTDTLRPFLWRVPVTSAGIGELESWIEFAGTPIVYDPERNLNGIARAAGGRSLIVGQMGKGLLFRVDIADRKITPIQLGGETISGADGLWLDGSMLYAVRQPDAEIVTVQLAADLASGKVLSRFRDPALLWPATAARAGDRLLVVNTQFNKRTSADPKLPFEVVGVPLSALSGGAGRP